MLQAFYQVITPVHSVFRYLQQIKLVTNKFFALSLIIFTPLYSWRMKATCYRFSVVTGLEGSFPLHSVLWLMEGVAGQEGYFSEDLLLRVVGWKS